MRPLELIDQILGRTPFKCTEKQMRFLRDLIVQHQDPVTLKQAAELHHKQVLAALRRNLTHAKKELKSAEDELKEAEKAEF